MIPFKRSFHWLAMGLSYVTIFTALAANSDNSRSAQAAAPPGADVLGDFNRLFLFSYLSWQNKAFTTNGDAVLHEFNNQGGAGINVEWNLASKADLVPALRLKVGLAKEAAALF